MKIRRSLLKDVVSVETYAGDGGYGPSYAAPVSIPCHVDTTRRLVLASDAAEAVSESTLFIHPDDAASFTPESRVTLSGRSVRVVTVDTKTVRGCDVFGEVTLA